MKGKGPAVGPPTTAARRIKKEIADLAKEDLGDIQLIPNEANIFVWKASLPGPASSPYEGGVFDVSITIPDDYPFTPPRLSFLTKVYHCNIAPSGAICLDLLKHAWSPALSLYKVILSLSSLLTDPNPSDPLVPAIASEYKSNRKKHDATARDWTKLYAVPKAKPQAKSTPATSATTSRLGAIRRPAAPAGSSTTTAAPSSTVTGRRRRDAPNPQANGTNEPIVLGSDDEDEADIGGTSDIEVLGENGRSRNQATTAKARPNKKPKTALPAAGTAGPGDDEVIVIDD